MTASNVFCSFAGRIWIRPSDKTTINYRVSYQRDQGLALIQAAVLETLFQVVRHLSLHASNTLVEIGESGAPFPNKKYFRCSGISELGAQRTFGKLAVKAKKPAL